MLSGLFSKKNLAIVTAVIFIVVSFIVWQLRQKQIDDLRVKQQKEHILSVMKTKLPSTLLPSKTLPLMQYVLPNATCYYFAGASIAHYLENDIDFDKFLWYGRPVRFKYDQRFGQLRSGPPAGELVMEAFYNLGYTAYQGNTRGQPMPAILLTHMTGSDNFIYFKTQKEAFDFIKRLVNVDVPVMLNGAPMRGKSVGDFGFLAGYDEQYVYVRPESTKQPFFYQDPEILTDFMKVPITEFLTIWARTNNEFYWFEKTQNRLSEDQVYQLNKADAFEAYANIQKFIADLPNKGSRSYSSDGDGVNSRASAYRYLKKLGYGQLAEKYLQIAYAYNNRQKNPFGSTGTYSEIANLEKEAASLWP